MSPPAFRPVARRAVLAAVLALPPAVSPAADTPVEAPAGTDARTLDTLVVTARKRSERALDTPVAVTVLMRERIDAGTLDVTADLLRRTPNATFVDLARPNERYGTLRGIGPLGAPLNSLDTTIGYAMDGVPTSALGFSQPLLDVQQVEILRGPQGTLFGRNALGGLVNVVSRLPDGERELRLGGEWGTHGHVSADAVGGGWLLQDRLAARAALRVQRFGGDIPNALRGGEDGGVSLAAGRVSLRSTPTVDWDLRVSMGASRDRRSNPTWLLKETDRFPLGGSDIEPDNDRDAAFATFELRRAFEHAQLTSISAWQALDVRTEDDYADSLLYARWLGGDPSTWADPTREKGVVTDRETLLQQEIRLASQDAAAWRWVVGVNWFRSDFTTLRVLQSDLWPTVNGVTDNRLVSETLAAFGDLTIPVGDRLWFSGGLRASRDTQTLDGDFRANGAPGLVPAFAQHGRYHDRYATGRVALSYALTPRMRLHASLADGYSSGGFERTTQNAGYGLPASPFQPARGRTLELGIKHDFDDGGRLAAALFRNDVRDGQVTAFDLVTYQTFFDNQDFRSEGLEIEGAWQMGRMFELTGGVGHTRSRLEGTSSASILGVVAGNEVPMTPDWTANLGARIQWDAARIGLTGRFDAHLDVQHVGERWSDPQNAVKLAPYRIANARLSWQNGNASLYVFVRNLTDERPVYYGNAYAAGVTAVIVGRGRVAGVGASYAW